MNFCWECSYQTDVSTRSKHHLDHKAPQATEDPVEKAKHKGQKWGCDLARGKTCHCTMSGETSTYIHYSSCEDMYLTRRSARDNLQADTCEEAGSACPQHLHTCPSGSEILFSLACLLFASAVQYPSANPKTQADDLTEKVSLRYLLAPLKQESLCTVHARSTWFIRALETGVLPGSICSDSMSQRFSL